MGTTEQFAHGYDDDTLDLWTRRARDWASGGTPKGLETLGKPAPATTSRDVYLYVISGFKTLNPAAGVAMIERLGG